MVQARKRAGLTQAALGLRLNMAASTVSGYESGRFQVSVDTAQRWAQETGVSLSWLLHGEEPPPSLPRDLTVRRLQECAAWPELLADRGKLAAFGISEAEVALAGNFPIATLGEPTKDELLRLLVAYHDLGKNSAARG